MMLGDIATGNTSMADVFFLIGLVLFLVGAIAHVIVPPIRWANAIVALGLASVAFAWLVL